MTFSKEIIAKNIMKLRLSKGLTQTELATILNSKYNKNLNKSTISKYENQKRNVSQKMLEIYVDYFKVSFDWIYGITS